MEDLLKEQLGVRDGTAYMAQYTLAKHKLINEIYEHIAGSEPSLSDHGQRHIANVLENAYNLIGHSFKKVGITGVEAYCLGMTILFHDVGNLFGRNDHRENINEVFDWVRGTEPRVRPEKTIVTRAAWAHTGSGFDNSSDTLKDLAPNEHLERQPVRLRSLAALLRFADELAEGPQRTSEFLRTKGLFTKASRPFHEYASMTHVHIDRGNARIALKYEMEVPQDLSVTESQAELTSLLRIIYTRVEKLDQERRYTKFYCDFLNPFSKTEVTFNFHHNGVVLSPLPPLELTDKVVPGLPHASIPEVNPDYSIEALIKRLLAECL